MSVSLEHPCTEALKRKVSDRISFRLSKGRYRRLEPSLIVRLKIIKSGGIKSLDVQNLQIPQMKYRITIRASFDYTVNVEAVDKATAEAKASDELMDYLDLTIRKTKEFDYFHEYMLREEVVSCDEVES